MMRLEGKSDCLRVGEQPGDVVYSPASEWRHFGQKAGVRSFIGASHPPQLTIIPSGTNVILTWPPNAAGFSLQSSTNLVSSAVLTAVFPATGIVKTQEAGIHPHPPPQPIFRPSGPEPCDE